MTSDLLQVDNLSRRFGQFWALRDASFTIRTGEILGLIGPNGAGKTTLFECVAGVQAPTAGMVSTNGEQIPVEKRKRHLFFLPDGIRPWPAQRVQWVLQFAAAFHDAHARVRDEVVAQLALNDLLDARLAELSKGEHRRVMLALGLLARQPLLMLDEPFDGLDLRQTREMTSVLRHHVAHGRTLFLSVHQLADAERVCDRLVLLSGGTVVGTGTVSDLQRASGVRNGSLEDVFLALT